MAESSAERNKLIFGKRVKSESQASSDQEIGLTISLSKKGMNNTDSAGRRGMGMSMAGSYASSGQHNGVQSPAGGQWCTVHCCSVPCVLAFQ